MDMTTFIKSQVAVWGQDYIDDLFDRKYFPVLTSAGWRWLYVSDEQFNELFATQVNQVVG